MSQKHTEINTDTHTHTLGVPNCSSVLFRARCQSSQMALVEDEVPVSAASEMWMPVSTLTAMLSASLSVKDLLTENKRSYRYSAKFQQWMSDFVWIVQRTWGVSPRFVVVTILFQRRFFFFFTPFQFTCKFLAGEPDTCTGFQWILLHIQLKLICHIFKHVSLNHFSASKG